MMRVILEPLIGDVPIVGAVSMFFIKRPVRPHTLTSICPSILVIALDAFHVIDLRWILTSSRHTAHSSVLSLPRN